MARPRTKCSSLPWTKARCRDNASIDLAGIGRINSMRLEIFQVAKRERSLVCRRQDHFRRVPCVKRFFPSRCAKAPAIAGLQPRKAPLKVWCGEVVAGRLGKGQEFCRQNDANGVRTDVL